ncbi:MAG: helix-hairpin-helix domain-containing protein [Candidatus Saliniplasma sp.]
MLERKVNFKFDLNTATLVDLISLTNMDINKARQILKTRKGKQGFKSLGEFKEEFPKEASSLVEFE